MAPEDYTKIDNPYSEFLKREWELNNPPGNPSDYDQNSGENVIKTGETLENLTINTWIKSRNYRPSKQGFLLDGKRGNFYGNNVFLTGTINALLGRIGSATDYWEIGSTGLTGFGNAIIQTNSGATTGIKLDTSSLRGYDAAGAISFQLFSATGNTRVNVLTNKSILFETITAPTAADGQLWCALNSGNKVLWGYFGGNITNKQQVSMSRMQESYWLDKTANDTIVLGPYWFQPRTIFFEGIFYNTTTTIQGTIRGQAGSVQTIAGACATTRNVYTDYTMVGVMTYNDVSNIPAGSGGISTYVDPKLPAAIDGGGHITSYWDIVGKSMISAASWTNNTIRNISTWTNITLSHPYTTIIVDSGHLAANNVLPAGAPEITITAGSWTDTGLTLTIVVTAGWHITGNLIILG